MKWLRRKTRRGVAPRPKRKGLRRQSPSRGARRQSEDPRRARAWRRRFRRLLRLESGNRRVDARSSRRDTDRRSLRRALRAVLGAARRGATYALVAALFAGLPFGSLLGYRYLVASPHFLLRQVAVAGNDTIASEAIVAAAGLDGAVSTLTLDEAEVAAAVTALDGVRTARVRLELPQSVHIEVTERRPAALVALGRPYLVDRQGALYRPAEPDEALDLPLLTGFRRADLTDPGRQADARRRIHAALDVLRAWDELGLTAVAPLSEVECDPVYGRIARTAESATEVWLGKAGDVRPRLERLADVLLDLKLRGRVARTIYLDGPDALERVVVRSVEERAASGLEQLARSEDAGR